MTKLGGIFINNGTFITEMVRSVNYDKLVEQVAFGARRVYELLQKDQRFKRRAVFLGRDATPIQHGVEFLNERGELEIAGFDISSKLLCENWHNYEPLSKRKRNFITRLNNNEITKEEMRGSLFFQYLVQERLVKDGELTLLDNGINGTLLSRLNKMLHIADPDLLINNIMLYYSGEIPLDNLTVVIEDARTYLEPGLLRAQHGMDYWLKCVDQGRRNAELESWPHPYASASHFYTESGKIMVGHEPNTSEGFTDWSEHIPLNEQLLERVRKILKRDH